MFEQIEQVLGRIDFNSITDSRKEELQSLVSYISEKNSKGEPIRLNFICTHNSRRSQLAQVWAMVAARNCQVLIESFSGGVEVTECNPRTIRSLERLGFKVEFKEEVNPKYAVYYSSDASPIILFSKLFDDAANPNSGFAAVMTCSDADENCPVVTGCEQRISLRYNDPKFYDDSPMEDSMYDYRSFQIATELLYVFSRIKEV
jgi:arsenate reductase